MSDWKDKPTADPVDEATASVMNDTAEQEHPADVAEALEAMGVEAGADYLETMPPEVAADVLEEMDEEDAVEFFEDMQPRAAAAALAEMSLDDAADLLGELAATDRSEILDLLAPEHRAELEGLLRYAPESAGGIMSPEVVALPANLTVPEAIEELRRIASESEQIYYTYVVDHQHRLVGVLSLRDLLLAKGAVTLNDIMIQRIVSVPAGMDREEVAGMLSHYGYYALPVVAEDGRLLGIVTVDDVFEVLEQEATEDMQRMVGAGADERIDTPIFRTVRSRLPWLLVNLGTAFLAATVVGAFEDQIAQVTALAVLMPVVAGQAGNTGAQSMAVVVRGIATGEARGVGLLKLVGRHTVVGVVSGVSIASVSAGAWYLWAGERDMALVLGAAMLLCMIVATVSGAVVPWIMKRLGFDPAQSSSIILTTITDITGFGVFLALGGWLIIHR